MLLEVENLRTYFYTRSGVIRADTSLLASVPYRSLLPPARILRG